MKLGILLCDHMARELQVAHGAYDVLYRTWLQAIKPEYQFTTYDLQQGHFPKRLDECDAYVITGSHFSVYEPIPWIDALHDTVRALHAAQKKLIGICFGHQLIARALGGDVIKSPKGWGVGASQEAIVCHKPWMVPAVEAITLCRSHQDQVMSLPPGAEVLSASEFCPYYMLQIGEYTLTIQGHPEFTKAYTTSLLTKREAVLGAEAYQQGIESLEQPIQGELLARWCSNFLES